MPYKNNIRWEVRYTDSKGKDWIHIRATRKTARIILRLVKKIGDSPNARMYRVSETLDDKGDPIMTSHKRAR